MRTPICITCERAMRIFKTGVVVVEHASFGPYTLQAADEFICPNCGIRAITSFANAILARHNDSDQGHSFDRHLLYALDAKTARHVFENDEQRARWYAQDQELWYLQAMRRLWPDP